MKETKERGAPEGAPLSFVQVIGASLTNLWLVISMSWYRIAKKEIRIALRKHNLNADLHIHSYEDPNTGQEADSITQRSHLQSVCASAVLKGLDIIGIISHYGFEPGNICKQIIQEKSYDLICLSGVEIISHEGLNLIVYDAVTVPSNDEGLETICQRAHSEGGVVMAIQPNKRNMQILNKIAGQPSAPDFIEIFNDITKGGYLNAFTDSSPSPEFQLLMNSASRNSSDVDKSIMMTRIPRNFLVEKGIIEEDTGVDYVPPYLQGIEGDRPVGGVSDQWPIAR